MLNNVIILVSLVVNSLSDSLGNEVEAASTKYGELEKGQSGCSEIFQSLVNTGCVEISSGIYLIAVLRQPFRRPLYHSNRTEQRLLSINVLCTMQLHWKLEKFPGYTYTYSTFKKALEPENIEPLSHAPLYYSLPVTTTCRRIKVY